MRKRKQWRLRLFGYELIFRRVRINNKGLFTDLIASGFAEILESTYIFNSTMPYMEKLLADKKGSIRKRKKRKKK